MKSAKTFNGNGHLKDYWNLQLSLLNPLVKFAENKYDWFKIFGFVPDSRFQILPIWAVAAEHLEDPTAYILQLTVSDGKSQKANIQINGKQVVTAFCSKNPQI